MAHELTASLIIAGGFSQYDCTITALFSDGSVKIRRKKPRSKSDTPKFIVETIPATGSRRLMAAFGDFQNLPCEGQVLVYEETTLASYVTGEITDIKNGWIIMSGQGIGFPSARLNSAFVPSCETEVMGKPKSGAKPKRPVADDGDGEAEKPRQPARAKTWK